MNEELKVKITAEIGELKKNVEDAKKQVKTFSDRVKEAKENVDANFKAAGESIKTGLKVGMTALAAAGTAVLALGASTKEYRNEQAKLKTAFEAAGASADTAKTTYNDLYRVLGDSGQATEAAAHLAQLTTNEKELSEWTNICQGVYATFGASLPIEGLTEAANETAKVGTVTGSLADALNWAGISEDEFNEKLAECNTEAQREKLIRETLNKTYDKAAKMYEKNNKDVLKQNEAQAKLDDTLAKLGETVAPIITMLTDLASNVLAALTPYIQSFAENYLPILQEILGTIVGYLGEAITWLLEHQTVLGIILGVIGGIVTAIGLYNAVAAVKEAMDKAQVTTIWELVAAHTAQLAPYLLIVAAIAAVIAIIVLCIKYWDDIVAAVKKAWEFICEAVEAGVDAVVGFFKGLWDGITNIFKGIGKWFSDIFTGAWNGIKSAFKAAGSFFSGVWNTIKGAFSAVGSWFSKIFSGAWEGIKKAFSAVGSFFTGIWTTIKNIFKDIGGSIGDAVSGAFKSAINWVLEKAIGLINGFISALNTAISVINYIPGVEISKIKKLDVPKLAKGGIVDGATLAMIGEQGKEAVVPLENNTEWLDKIAARLGTNSKKPIYLMIDKRVLGVASAEGINDITRQTGNIPLIIG